MDQKTDLNNNRKTPAKSAPKQDVHFDWFELMKKAFLPICILMIAFGLFLAVWNVMQLINASADTAAATTGMEITSILLGLVLIVGGVLGVMKKSKKAEMTLGVLALVIAIVVLAGTASTGLAAILLGVSAIVLSCLFILAVDGVFGMGLARFFREMFGELKKLTWLSGKELFSHTLAVIVFVLAMALLIYLLDLGFSSGFGALAKIKIG